MDSFRRRYASVRDAEREVDDTRSALIADLLQKVDDMQKTMERNAFVIVLIDGDNMNVRTTPSRLYLPKLLFVYLRAKH